MRAAQAAALALALAAQAPAATAADLRIDSTHSYAGFGVRLLWLHTIHGRFTRVSGSFEPQPDGRVVVAAQVAVDSLAMDSARLRRWVLAEEFFDAARYPTLRFVSAPVSRATLTHGGPLDGRMTLRGVTRPVQLQLEPADCEVGVCTIEAHGEVQRSDFGMRNHHTVLSDRVALALSIALAREPG
jgi:polyisoprenoid-binding protein YceI